MSDEATLNHQVKVNKQNVRYWSAENPKEIYDYPHPAGKVTVWDHLASFEDNEGRTVTVNYSVRYVAMITPQLCLIEMY